MAVSVEHLRREYGSFVAVDDLSFAVQPGEIVGLIGPNGAGKTTTLRSLAGILRPTSGRVAIDGHDIVEQSIEAKRRLAFMPDEPHLFEYLTVEEHLRLVGRLYGITRIDERARPLLDELELKGKERSLPGELSRVIIMARGQKVADGTFAELASRADLAEAGSNLEQIFMRVTGHDMPDARVTKT